MRDNIASASYLVAGLLFVASLTWMGTPVTARRGVQAAQAGMLVAVIGTLVRSEVVSYEWIVLGLVVGTAAGVPMALLMPMTAMPQRTALSHAFGALAAGLVGTAEYTLRSPGLDRGTMLALSFEILLASLTVTGSLFAFAKLQELIPGRPMVFTGQRRVNLSILALAVLCGAGLVIDPDLRILMPFMIVLAVAFGALFILPIGGADMPTVIALLNSYAGLSGAAMGFALDNRVLIIAGALDGSSGFILAVMMSKAMNRNFRNILFGAFGQVKTTASGAIDDRPIRSASAQDAAYILEHARLVIIVPGYGMAVAQAQHKVRELFDHLTALGAEVLFAIHPVAGRMPGHMNVLLAEADIPYDRLIEMEEINAEFPQADVALVIGANDVTNPAARHSEGSPVYGMPILDVDKAQNVFVVKRSMRPGFAGIENELYYEENTTMLFGDAKTVVGDLVGALGTIRESAA